MDLAKDKMIFEDLNITLKIYDIREGEPGNKPSFLQMKADIKLIKEINRKEQLARALNSRSLYANLSFVPTVPRKNTGRTLLTQNSDLSNDYSDDEADPIRVIIAGGDGTVMWGMMELGVFILSFTCKETEMCFAYNCAESSSFKLFLIMLSKSLSTVLLYVGNHDISPSDIVIAPLPLGTGEELTVHNIL